VASTHIQLVYVANQIIEAIHDFYVFPTIECESVSISVVNLLNEVLDISHSGSVTAAVHLPSPLPANHQ
jgi:hypothetical protein